MPRTCHEIVFKKLDTMTYLNFLANPLEQACEKIAFSTGNSPSIWGTFDEEITIEYISWTDMNWWREFLLSLWAPDKIYFKLIVHTLLVLAGFLLGILYRYSTIRSLKSENQTITNKTNTMMQQLWSTMEEKLTLKNRVQALESEKDQEKRDKTLLEGEIENLKTRNWGLDRNVTILQSDRSALEGKIRDLLNVSQITKDSFVGGGGLRDDTITAQEELRACKQKMINLQGLVKSLIEHTKQKDATMVSAMQNSSHV